MIVLVSIRFFSTNMFVLPIKVCLFFANNLKLFFVPVCGKNLCSESALKDNHVCIDSRTHLATSAATD